MKCGFCIDIHFDYFYFEINEKEFQHHYLKKINNKILPSIK